MGTGGAPLGACAGPGWNPHRQVGWAGVGLARWAPLGRLAFGSGQSDWRRKASRQVLACSGLSGALRSSGDGM